MTSRGAMHSVRCKVVSGVACAIVRSWRRFAGGLLGLTLAVLVTSAHVGSPDVWLEGKAGPYPVVVNVQVPSVVPGVAQVYVRVTGSGVHRVAVTTNKFDATGGSPPPDDATPVEGDPGLYHAPLWIMTPGSNSVTVFVVGAMGAGKLVVPVVAIANRRLGFSRPLAVGLSVVGVLLFLGALSILGAITREAVLPPGAAPDQSRRHRARLVMAASAIGFAVLLFGGWRWWNAEDAAFARTLYKPMAARTVVRTTGGVASLDLVITDTAWLFRNDSLWLLLTRAASRNASALSPLITDHGKLMHLFLVRESDTLAFAHLHPVTTDSVTFSAVLPPLPAGRYRVLGDVVLASGEGKTIVTTAEVPAPVGDVQLRPAGMDPDDAWHVGGATGDTATLEDGSIMRWDRGNVPVVVGRPAPLAFTVTDVAGNPVTLQPYMGMAAHAIVLRHDGAVFVHLHPTGTVPMGAQAVFAERTSTDTVTRTGERPVLGDSGADKVAGRVAGAMGMDMTGMPMTVSGNTVRFPYAFSKPGRYTLWVQVKREGRVLTGVFETDVR